MNSLVLSSDSASQVMATRWRSTSMPMLLTCFLNARLRLQAGELSSRGMSDKQLVLEAIERLPDDVSLDVIAERVEFLAAIRKGLDQVERGETVPHDEVKRQLASWLSK